MCIKMMYNITHLFKNVFQYQMATNVQQYKTTITLAPT